MKLFIGGLSYDTTDATLREYFTRFGRVVAAVVMREQSSGQSRGFGFVAFADAIGANAVLEARDHLIDGRWVEAKAAVPRGTGQLHGGPGPARSPVRPAAAANRNADYSPPWDGGEEDEGSREPSSQAGQHRKVFVGGLHGDTGDASLSSYFSEFGPVDGAQVLYNRNTGRSRGFGFVTFTDAAGLAAALASRMHIIDGKLVEVKPAVPKTGRGGPDPGASEGEEAHTPTRTAPSAGHSPAQRPTSLVASARPFQPRGRGSSRGTRPRGSSRAGRPPAASDSSGAGRAGLAQHAPSASPHSGSEGSDRGRLRNGSFGGHSRDTGPSDVSPVVRLTPTPPLEAPPPRERASTGASWASGESGAEWAGGSVGPGATVGRVASDETRWRQLGRAAATGDGDVSHLLVGGRSRGQEPVLGANLWDATAADRTTLESFLLGGAMGAGGGGDAAVPTDAGVWRSEGEEGRGETASPGTGAMVDSLLATAVPDLGSDLAGAARNGGGDSGGDGGEGRAWRRGVEKVWGVSAGAQ